MELPRRGFRVKIYPDYMKCLNRSLPLKLWWPRLVSQRHLEQLYLSVSADPRREERAFEIRPELVLLTLLLQLKTSKLRETWSRTMQEWPQMRYRTVLALDLQQQIPSNPASPIFFRSGAMRLISVSKQQQQNLLRGTQFDSNERPVRAATRCCRQRWWRHTVWRVKQVVRVHGKMCAGARGIFRKACIFVCMFIQLAVSNNVWIAPRI